MYTLLLPNGEGYSREYLEDKDLATVHAARRRGVVVGRMSGKIWADFRGSSPRGLDYLPQPLK